MNQNFIKRIQEEVAEIDAAGLFKRERIITSEQGPEITVNGKTVLNFCANNYLGLSSHPKVIEAAHKAIDTHGYGMSSVRFICGTQDIHKELEEKIANFLGTEDTILYAAAFDANGGVFEPLFNEQDAIISDALNHASIIDGIRLSRVAVKTTDLKAYPHNQIDQLATWLEENIKDNYRLKFIVSDGVFSMEGDIAPLPRLLELATRYGALLFVDDSHSTGVLGATGRGTAEELGLHGKIDVISGTLGKALGGASGGFIAGKRSLVDFLRQKSRPYTFSNTVPPAIVAASLEAITMLEEDTSLVDKLHENTMYFRSEIVQAGFTILPGKHPIVPVMLGEASTAMDMSQELLELGVYVRGLWYPVVPKGEARLRVQISAAHSRENLDHALTAFAKAGKKLGVIS